MNAAAKELPVSYDLSKPQEDREPYVGSVLFFKHVIFTVTLLLILIPTTLSIYLFAQVRSLNRQLDTAGSQLAAMQEQLPSTAPEGGEPTPAEPEPPAAEVPAYTELYPELYADDSLRGTVDVDNAVYLTFSCHLCVTCTYLDTCFLSGLCHGGGYLLKLIHWKALLDNESTGEIQRLCAHAGKVVHSAANT